MSDKTDKKGIIILIVIILIVASVGLYGVFGESLFKQKNQTSNIKPTATSSQAPKLISNATSIDVIRDENAVQNRYCQYKDGILIANRGNLTFMDKKASVKWVVPVKANVPILSVNGDEILLADKDGKDIYLFNNNKVIYHKEFATTLRSAKINQSSFVSIVCDEPYYNGKAVIYDKKGDELFVYKSGSAYIIDTAVSPNNRVCIATFTTEGALKSKLLFFNISEKEPYANFEIEKLVTMQVEYNAENIIAISDEKIFNINQKGESTSTYEYSEKTLEHYDITNDYISIVISRGQTSSVVVLDKKFKVKSEIQLNDVPKFINIYKNNFLRSKGQEAIKTNSDGKEIKSFLLSKEIKNIIEFNDGNYYLAVFSGGYEIVKG